MSWLPEWASSLRPQQRDAIGLILDGYARGMDVMILDGPTGTGKTLIAEIVRREMGVRGTYVAHSLSLQNQFLANFPESRVLKGRGNYRVRGMYTAADCMGDKCGLCESVNVCPYTVAKMAAARAEVAVLNTSFLLAFPGRLFFREFMVLDECDTLESIMLGHYEFAISGRMLGRLGVETPAKGAHAATVARWVEGELTPALHRNFEYLEARVNEGQVGLVRARDGAARTIEAAEILARQLGDPETPWVRDYSWAGAFVMKPVKVSAQANGLLWARGSGRSSGPSSSRPKQRWLAMSATIADVDEWVDSTGVEQAGLAWELVRLGNRWPRRNRPVVTRTWGDMGKGGGQGDRERVVGKIVEICERHVKEGESVLVHSVNYSLTAEIVGRLRDAELDVWTYGKSGERDQALEDFKRWGGVIVAPSLDRGIDLPDDLCRVQVIAKMPFLNLGDRQVAERLHTRGGERWYKVQAARTLVQMTGRGIRHENDRAVTYILDSAYDGFYRNWRWLLPKWWRDSAVGELPTDWFDRRDNDG